jgi:hypothetical protein
MKMQLDIVRYNISFLEGKNDFLKNVAIGTGKEYKDFFTLQKGE